MGKRASSWFALACMLVSCGGQWDLRDPKPPKLPKELNFETCTQVERAPYDPGGQGRELVGFGLPLHVKKSDHHDPREGRPIRPGPSGERPFGRIDRFDPGQIKFKDGTPVADFTINDFTLSGTVTKGVVKHELAPDEWVGARFKGRLACPNPALIGQELPVTIEISEAIEVLDDDAPKSTPPSPTAAKITAYKFVVVGQSSYALCQDADGEESAAFPVPGHWEEDHHYHRASQLFTFACKPRNLAKCLLGAGYALGAPQAGNLDWLEACARMMVADYCGDGQSFTHDRTQVNLWDTSGHNPHVPNPKLAFEGAWDHQGVVCLNRPRWDLAEWEKRGRFAPCLAQKPTCTSAAAAPQGRDLIFVESCLQHPCDREPTSWGEAPPSSGPVK